jgi:hypothetical protein
MASQNLVSSVLSDETKAEVLAHLSSVKSALGFLITLRGSEIQSIIKVGNGYAPFLDKAYSVVTNHADIMPSVFDLTEFKKDYELAKALSSVVEQIKELANSLSNTLTAVNSDSMAAALEVYAAVKQNVDKVPGLNVAYAEMAEFFKRTKKTTTTASATA